MLYNIFSSPTKSTPNTTDKHQGRGAPQAPDAERRGHKNRDKKLLLTTEGTTETPTAQRAQNARPIKNEQA